LYDRRRILTEFADKIQVREFVLNKYGEDILPKIYFQANSADRIDWYSLPKRFVLKPSHGSGWVKIVNDVKAADIVELEELCAFWLSNNYYHRTREWQYKNILPTVFAEEYIDDGTGHAPTDYKFFVFGGKVQVVQVDRDRFVGHKRQLFSPEWLPIAVDYEYCRPENIPEKPDSLSNMIQIAEILGCDMDFVRVDLYAAQSKIYFGEMTMTPDCGMGRFRPKSYDRELGAYWKLVPNTDGYVR